jgi:hypothetical protein
LTAFVAHRRNPGIRTDQIAWGDTVRHLSGAVLGFASIALATSVSASPRSVDPGYYRNYTCQQLTEAARQISAQAVALADEADETPAANRESTVDVVVVPRLVSGRKTVSDELLQFRQQMLAIEDASIQSQCEIEFLDKVN